MSHASRDPTQEMYDALHQTLRTWGKQEPSAERPLSQLLLIQQELQALTKQTSLPSWQKAVYNIIEKALRVLEEQNERCAQVLRLRFIEKKAIYEVAGILNIGQNTVSKDQRAGIEALAEIILGWERAIRQNRVQQLESILPPPTFTRLFGVEAFGDSLRACLTVPGSPWVIALIGMGGLGKTAVANWITRSLIRQLAFTHVVWVKADPPHSLSGKSASPPLTYEKIMQQLARQLHPGSQAPASSVDLVVKVRQALKDRAYLVVIDNLEDAKDTAYLLNQLIDLANPAKFVLTTRTRGGKQAGVREMPLGELTEADSLAFIRYHAGETGIDAVSTAADADLKQIYEKVGGNPFALKMAVSLLDMLPLNRLLIGLERNHPDQVSQMYTHIFWQAWQSLSDNGRALLKAMPLVVEPAEADYLLSISGLSESELVPAIEELRHRSLLEIEGDMHEKKYGIHRLTDTFLRTEII